MSLFPRALLACGVLICAAMTARAATVRGNVTEADSHAPLIGMAVAAYDTAGTLRGTATTDATGLYLLSIPSGDYRVLAYDPNGIYATTFDGNADSFETTPVRTVGSGGAEIHFGMVKGGRVTGAVARANGIPPTGAVVEAYNLSGTRRGFTSADASGSYSLVLPPGTYKLVAYDIVGTYAAIFYRQARTFDEATPVQVTASKETENIFFTLELAARVTGKAIDDATDTPLASIDIYAYTPSGQQVAKTTTDAFGAFRLSLPAGQYRFVAADPKRTFAPAYYNGSRSFDRADVMTLVEGEQRANVDIALVRGVLVSGRVSAPNVTVGAFTLDGALHSSATSGAGGQYALVVAPGEYKIGAFDSSLTYATRFYPDTADFRFAERLWMLGNTGGINLTLPRGGRITGTVRRPNGQPFTGIIVAAYDSSGTAIAQSVSAADGKYTIVVAPGAYRVLAFDTQLTCATSYAGGATSFDTTVPRQVAADAVVAVNLDMRSGLRVGGQVLSERGAALSDIEVVALDAAGNRVGGATSRDGSFTVVVLPGTYRLFAYDPANRYYAAEHPDSVTVTEAQIPLPITFTLETVVRRRSVRH